MIAIKCKNGNIISAIVDGYVDAEWKVQQMYYEAQGCIVEKQREVQFQECNCEHCQTLEHDYEDIIEEIRHT